MRETETEKQYKPGSSFQEYKKKRLMTTGMNPKQNACLPEEPAAANQTQMNRHPGPPPTCCGLTLWSGSAVVCPEKWVLQCNNRSHASRIVSSISLHRLPRHWLEFQGPSQGRPGGCCLYYSPAPLHNALICPRSSMFPSQAVM